MCKIRISAVSYLNTLPFIFGIQHDATLQKHVKLSLDFPSICAKKVIQNEVEIGLIPVAAIPQVEHPEIISDFCIGADGKVETVLLLSDVPKEEIRCVHLDYQSRTSVQLVRILARKFWHIEPQWKNAVRGFETTINKPDGAVVIGDRTFGLEHKYRYRYDLAEEWKKYTGLPFVFAAWIANSKLPENFTDAFNNALKYGISNIETVIQKYEKENKSDIDLRKYLTQNIQYNLDSKKLEAMNKFLKLIEEKVH